MTRAGISLAVLWGGQMIGAAVALISQVVLARCLGPSYYGSFISALAAILIIAPVAAFGLAGFWLKAFGVEGWGAYRWLRASLRFVLGSSTLAIVLAVAWALMGPHETATQSMLLLLIPHLLAYMALELVTAKFQLEEEYTKIALWQVVPHVARLLLMLLVMEVVSPAQYFPAFGGIYLFVGVASAVLGGLVVRDLAHGRLRLVGHEAVSGDSVSTRSAAPSARELFENTWPFGLAGVFYLIFFQSQLVLVELLVGPVVAGVFGVAFTFLAAMYLLPNVVYQKFLLPKLHRWAVHDRVLFRRVFDRGNALMAVLGVAFGFALFSLAPSIIDMFFGDEYSESATLLRLLALAVPVRFLATSVGAVLVTQDHMRRKVAIMGVAAVVNVFLGLFFIPKYLATGATISIVLSEALLLLLYARAARIYVFS